MKRLLLAAASLAALVAAQSCAVPPKSMDQARTGAPQAEFGAWGVDLGARDTSVKPGDDFNRYANGAWLDTFEIPGDLSNYGVFTKLRLDAERDIRAIVEELASAKSSKGSLEQKVGDYYGAWMNTGALDAKGAAPLKPYLGEIAAIETRADLMTAFSQLHNTSPFGVGIIPDPADTTRYIAFVGQGGIGMPNRDYYLKEEERYVQYREAYLRYMTTVMSLAGIEGAAGKAKAILALETKIAQAHWTPEDSRNIRKIYNPMGLDKLQALAPQFDWTYIMGELGLASVDTFVVAQTTAIAGAAELLDSTPLDTWKDYLAFHMIRTHANYLSSDFDMAHFEFYSKTLSGTQEQRERWKRGVSLINGGLGEAVGQIYVERHFPAKNKAQMDELVANLTDAFAERLAQNEWMDEATREQALLKLSTFEPRIGYPTKWTDYSPLKIKKGDLLGNVLAVSKFQWDDQVRRLGGPVDREQWGYPPQTVNASYNPLLNQITFPAGILQPPFFDPNADAAVNYGAIGAVIGHEIGHGFDDQGRRFDEKGRIRDWWSKEADERFSKRTDKFGTQYASYEPLPGQAINPQLTMGENIGDLGGVEMAYAAYKRHLDECCEGKDKVIGGFTGDQRFFLSWAQIWRAKYREDALRQRLLTDPHSPAAYRINGIVRNHNAWYEAFGVKKGDALYLAPGERVHIW